MEKGSVWNNIFNELRREEYLKEKLKNPFLFNRKKIDYE